MAAERRVSGSGYWITNLDNEENGSLDDVLKTKQEKALDVELNMNWWMELVTNTLVDYGMRVMALQSQGTYALSLAGEAWEAPSTKTLQLAFVVGWVLSMAVWLFMGLWAMRKWMKSDASSGDFTPENLTWGIKLRRLACCLASIQDVMLKFPTLLHPSHLHIEVYAFETPAGTNDNDARYRAWHVRFASEVLYKFINAEAMTVQWPLDILTVVMFGIAVANLQTEWSWYGFATLPLSMISILRTFFIYCEYYSLRYQVKKELKEDIVGKDLKLRKSSQLFYESRFGKYSPDKRRCTCHGLCERLCKCLTCNKHTRTQDAKSLHLPDASAPLMGEA